MRVDCNREQIHTAQRETCPALFGEHTKGTLYILLNLTTFLALTAHILLNASNEDRDEKRMSW